VSVEAIEVESSEKCPVHTDRAMGMACRGAPAGKSPEPTDGPDGAASCCQMNHLWGGGIVLERSSACRLLVATGGSAEPAPPRVSRRPRSMAPWRLFAPCKACQSLRDCDVFRTQG